MILATVRTVMIVLFGVLLFKVSFVLNQPLLILALFVLTLTALFSLGMVASSIYFLVGRAGIKINIALMEPVFLLTGVYFPVKNLGFILSIIGAMIPLTLGLDGIRQLILPTGKEMGLLSPGTEILILLGMTIVFTLLAFRAMAYMERLGKKEGRMTLRWQ